MMTDSKKRNIALGADGSYASALADFFLEHFPDFVRDETLGEKTGIYLVTNTAGILESVTFWKEALDKTPSFANPANFPWTLANAPAAYIASVLKVKGPVYTFVGNEDEVLFSRQRAMIDLKQETIRQALLIRLDRADQHLNIEISTVDC